MTSGLIDAVRLVGPSTPITKRGLRGSSFGFGGIAGGARQPRAFAVQLVHQVLQVVVGLRDRGRVEGVGLDQVGAGFEVGAWMPRMISGRVSVSRSLLPWSWPRSRSRGRARGRSVA